MLNYFDLILQIYFNPKIISNLMCLFPVTSLKSLSLHKVVNNLDNRKKTEVQIQSDNTGMQNKKPQFSAP